MDHFKSRLRAQLLAVVAWYCTPDVANRFLETSMAAHPAAMQFNSDINWAPCPPWPVYANTSEWVHACRNRHTDSIPCEWQPHQNRRKRRNTKRSTASPLPKPMPLPATPPSRRWSILRVDNRDLLRRYYLKAFENFQQLNCRAIAKSYIKLVEPRKQVHYPYNGRKVISGVPQHLDPEQTKPAWWPAGVLHREPDHLLKRDRLHLLVHICEVM